MASNYTNLGIQLMTTGEKAGTWGTLTNTNWNIIEQISGGFKVQTLNAAGSGANTTTLDIDDGAVTGAAQNRVIILGAVSPEAITGNKIVTVPLLTETFYIIKNSTSGAYTVQLKAVSGSGATVTWATDDKGYKLVYVDGVATNTGVIDTGFSTTTGDVTLTGTQTLTNKTLTSPKIGTNILDTAGNELINLTATGSAVNEITLANAAADNNPIISLTGTSTDIGLTILPKGAGTLTVQGNSTQPGEIRLFNDTDETTYHTGFKPGILTENIVYTLPTADAANAGEALKSNASGVLSWGAAGLAWQAVTTASTLTAVAGKGYPINTTSNACTITLPASASTGDTIQFVDYARTWGTNKITLDQQSLKFQGYTTPNPFFDVDGDSLTIVYADATQGWMLVEYDDVPNKVPQSYSVSHLVISGGGGGGYNNAGGGGGGGFRDSYAPDSNSGRLSPIEAQTTLVESIVYTATIGAGAGSASSVNNSGAAGVLTKLTGDATSLGGAVLSLQSQGGGAGGGWNVHTGGTGGCGGGGADGHSSSGIGGSGTAGQGFDGGPVTSDTGVGGGGGGAGAVGVTAITSGSFAGGVGLDSDITGSTVTYAAGAGGGPWTSATNGAANTGIAGSAYTPSGTGGSGIIILRMPDAKYSGIVTGSPTVATGVGGTDTVISFTGTGTYTA